MAFFTYVRGIVFLAIFTIISNALYGQNIANYVFSATAGTYTSIANPQAISTSSADDTGYADIPIGFEFWYMGQRYTSFSVSTNGWMSLGSTIAADGTPTNNLSSGGNRPIIAPLWDDLAIFPGILSTGIAPGNITYNLTGTAGSRVVTVQWYAMRWDRNSAVIIPLVLPTAVITFQAKIYENGNVEFVYYQDGGTVRNGSASIGITGPNSGVFRSLNNTGTNPTASTTTETTSLATKPATGQTYTFNPTELAAPSLLTFSNVGSTGMTVNWQDNSTGEIGFVIYRSTNGSSFSYLTTTAANASSYNDAGLSNGTTYYYRVYALRENLSTTAASGSQLATCANFTLGSSPNATGAGNNGPVCAGTTLTLSTNAVSGASYSWTGPNGFTSALQNPTLTFTDAAKGTYTVTVSRNGCSLSASTTVTSTGEGLWTGNVSNSWSVAGNWCNGLVPTAGVNVTIPAGLTNYPLVTGTPAVNNLTIAAGASVAVTGSLSIAGAISNNGTFVADNGGIILNGTSAQTIPAATFANNLIKNLSISNTAGVTLNGALRLTGVLAVNAGVFQTNANLTLASNAVSTANVASIPSTASISGNVKVERYVQGGTLNPYRTYRMLSSPVYDNSPSFNNADVEGNRSAKFSQLIDDVIITGIGGSVNGFDQTALNNTAAWTYNNGFTPIPAINTAVNAGKGMYIFYRGNRDNFQGKTVSPFVNPESTVIDFDGILNQQNITVSLNYGPTSNGAYGFNLVGNPYAATIDWDSSNWGTDKVNLRNAIWIWNPATRSYATYANGVGTLGGSRYIAPGQAFFVRTTAAGSIRFKENVKAATVQAPVLLLNADKTIAARQNITNVLEERHLLRIVMKPAASPGEDETVLVFTADANPNFDEDDVLHLDGELVNVSSQDAQGNKMAINILPTPSQTMQVALNIGASATGNYYFQFNVDEYQQPHRLTLRDNYLNTNTLITSNLVHNFAIDKTNAQTFGATRFVITVEPPAVLPVGLLSFTAKKQYNHVLLNWATSYETNNKLYKIYRAGVDGNFTVITDVPAKGAGQYSFTDVAPLPSRNYYKLVQIDADGTETATAPVLVNFAINEVDGVVIYPNPVVSYFNVQLAGLTANNYKLKLYDLMGKKLNEVDVTKVALNEGYQVDASTISSGVFFVQVEDSTTGEIVASEKLVKY